MEDYNENLSQISPALQTSEKQGSKQKNTSKVIIAILAVLALAGIGFGVYGMIRKPEEKPVENDTMELETELSDIKQKYSVLQNYVKELEASGTEIPEEAKSATEDKSTGESSSFATFSKNLAGTRREVHFEPSRVFYNCDTTGQNSDRFCGYFIFGSIGIDEENSLKISLGQTKQIATLQAEASDVLFATYVEHSTYDTGNQTFRGDTASQYVYYTNLSGDVYRIKLTESESLPAEHLEEYKEIAFIENTSSGALLVDIYGRTFTVSE